MKDGVVRAGIVVTGTEVITGRISDANGPWVERTARRPRGRGRPHHRRRRPSRRPRARPTVLGAEDMDLIVTSGGLGPTADDLTAEIVGRFAGRPMRAGRGHGGEDPARSCAASPQPQLQIRRRGRDGGQSQAGDGARGGRSPLDPIGTAPGLVVPVAVERVVIVLPGPPRELRPMWPLALETDGRQGGPGRATPLHGLTMRMFGVPGVGNREEPAGDLGRRRGGRGGGRGDHLPARGEIEIDVRWRDETEATRDGGPRRAAAAP